jgi:hypothetical protein
MSANQTLTQFDIDQVRARHERAKKILRDLSGMKEADCEFANSDHVDADLMDDIYDYVNGSILKKLRKRHLPIDFYYARVDNERIRATRCAWNPRNRLVAIGESRSVRLHDEQGEDAFPQHVQLEVFQHLEMANNARVSRVTRGRVTMLLGRSRKPVFVRLAYPLDTGTTRTYRIESISTAKNPHPAIRTIE